MPSHRRSVIKGQKKQKG
uniref:Uncharacterized protein n=1 Tax=Anguilla anguilla TaxID=7936 RepID=A0A0E9SGH5_ANGAN